MQFAANNAYKRGIGVFHIPDENPKPKMKEDPVYNVKVALMGKKWSLVKKWEDFMSFNSQLSEVCSYLPAFPTKKNSSIFGPAKVVSKEKELSDYLQNCFKIDEVFMGTVVADFLEYEKHVPELSIQRMDPVGTLGEKKLPIKDFFINRERNSVVTVSGGHPSDMAGAFKSFLKIPSNTGEVEKHSLSVNPGGVHLFQSEYLEKFSSSATCIKHIEDEKMIVVGNSIGHLVVYTYEPGKPEFTESMNIKVHSKSIKAIDHDPLRKCFYTISGGNKLRTVSYTSKSVVNGSLF